MSEASMTKSEATAIAGTLGEPSKMPCFAYGLPARACITGAKLVDVPGSVCEKCYALRGNYIFQRVQSAQYKRLDAITHPEWTRAMIALISGNTGERAKHFRWHDSGDLQSVAHLARIVEIARALPGVRFWLPTREYAIVQEFAKGNAIPSNLVIRLSAHKVDGPPPAIAGFCSSGVHSDKAPRGARSCPAPSQGNACGDCRACWNPKVKHVSYHKH